MRQHMGGNELKPMPGGCTSSNEDFGTHDSDTESTRSNICEAPAEHLPTSFDIDDHSDSECTGEASTHHPSPQKLQLSEDCNLDTASMAPNLSKPTFTQAFGQSGSSKGSTKTFTTTQVKEWTHDIMGLTNLRQFDKVIDIMRKLSNGRVTREGVVDSGLGYPVAKLMFCNIPDLALPASSLIKAWMADPDIGSSMQRKDQPRNLLQDPGSNSSLELTIEDVSVFQLGLESSIKKPQLYSSARWPLHQLRDRTISANILNFTGIHITVHRLLTDSRPEFRVLATQTLGNWRRTGLVQDNFDGSQAPFIPYSIPSIPGSGETVSQDDSITPLGNGARVQALPVAALGLTNSAAFAKDNSSNLETVNIRTKAEQGSPVPSPTAFSAPEEPLLTESRGSRKLLGDSTSESPHLTTQEVHALQGTLYIYIRTSKWCERAVDVLQQLTDRPVSAEVLEFTTIHLTVQQILLNNARANMAVKEMARLLMEKWRYAGLLPANPQTPGEVFGKESGAMPADPHLIAPPSRPTSGVLFGGSSSSVPSSAPNTRPLFGLSQGSAAASGNAFNFNAPGSDCQARREPFLFSRSSNHQPLARKSLSQIMNEKTKTLMRTDTAKMPKQSTADGTPIRDFDAKFPFRAPAVQNMPSVPTMLGYGSNPNAKVSDNKAPVRPPTAPLRPDFTQKPSHQDVPSNIPAAGTQTSNTANAIAVQSRKYEPLPVEDIVILTQGEFLSLAQARLRLDSEAFSKLKGHLASYFDAVVEHLDEYARHKTLVHVGDRSSRVDASVIETSKNAAIETRSAFLKVVVTALEKAATSFIMSWETSEGTQSTQGNELVSKTSEDSVGMMKKQLLAFETTISDLKKKLKTSEAQATNSAAEAEKVRRETEWQQKASDEQQRKLEGSFSQKVEERVSKRVREEHANLSERLQAAENKALRHDEATVKVTELERQIKDLAYEKTSWLTTKLRLEMESKTLKGNNEAIEEGYQQVRLEKDEANRRIMELEEELGSVTADRDSFMELARENQKEATASEAGTSAQVQLIANTGRMTELDRTRRIKDDLQNQFERLQAESKTYDQQLEEVEERVAVREMDLAKLKGEEKKKGKQGKREPLSELDQTNSHEQSGES